jgi:hypothetical protein
MTMRLSTGGRRLVARAGRLEAQAVMRLGGSAVAIPRALTLVRR